MTSLPALQFGLKNKGRLCAGADADIVIFDPAEIADTATFDEPVKPPVGIDFVLVNGEIAVEKSVIKKRDSGHSLRF